MFDLIKIKAIQLTTKRIVIIIDVKYGLICRNLIENQPLDITNYYYKLYKKLTLIIYSLFFAAFFF